MFGRYIHGGYQPEGPEIKLADIKPPPMDSEPLARYDENCTNVSVASDEQYVPVPSDKDSVAVRVGTLKPYSGYMLDGDTF